MTTEKTEKAEHVSGIVLQPLWRIQKIDWTVRKNVFEKSMVAYSLTAPLPFTDDRPFREPRNNHNPSSFIRSESSLKETAYMLHRELTGRGKERPTVPHRYRPAYNRKRWNCDLVRKLP
ncbi:hypothetical protein ElyMa_004478700 [Elysia marginata]|uniref:Uncharacterized protein n=1 Tax=Elysia marginata TaxID=1093978 RepID=A0AAV4HI10_9GAST|nr:hypothetical protein ElyMa_004478700 [Elysia marginata]